MSPVAKRAVTGMAAVAAAGMLNTREIETLVSRLFSKRFEWMAHASALADREDFQQAAMLMVLRRLPRFDPARMNLVRWVQATAANAFIDEMRRLSPGPRLRGPMERQAERPVFVDDSEKVLGRLHATVDQPFPDDFADLLRRAILKLPPREQLVWHLWNAGESLTNIGGVLDVVPSRVSQIKRRALELLALDRELIAWRRS